MRVGFKELGFNITPYASPRVKLGIGLGAGLLAWGLISEGSSSSVNPSTINTGGTNTVIPSGTHDATFQSAYSIDWSGTNGGENWKVSFREWRGSWYPQYPSPATIKPFTPDSKDYSSFTLPGANQVCDVFIGSSGPDTLNCSKPLRRVALNQRVNR